jgi:hypothetical protein
VHASQQISPPPGCGRRNVRVWIGDRRLAGHAGRWVGSWRLLEVLMRSRLIAAVRSPHRLIPDSGMTTAEYAVGTVAACGFGGILYKVLTSDEVRTLLKDILKRALTMSF